VGRDQRVFQAVVRLGTALSEAGHYTAWIRITPLPSDMATPRQQRHVTTALPYPPHAGMTRPHMAMTSFDGAMGSMGSGMGIGVGGEGPVMVKRQRTMSDVSVAV
jgi:hypothetical protein